jgi:hypothetical protein
VHFTL